MFLINYVPLLYPKYVPAVIETIPQRQEFWRVLNAAADTIFNLQVMVNNAPQPLRCWRSMAFPLSAEQARLPASLLKSSSRPAHARNS